MKNFLVEPAWWSFLFQALVFTLYIPLSYCAYTLQVQLKYKEVEQSLTRLGVPQENWGNLLGKRKKKKSGYEYYPRGYRARHYAMPLFLAYASMFISYSMVHPYIIKCGLWSGALEEVLNVFGADDLFPRAILTGRFLLWGWLGSWLYSLHLTFRRFLAYDLTPSVYIFTANRFLLAFTAGAVVGTWIGTSGTKLGVPFDLNMATVYVVTFGLGFFPEWAITWIAATLRKALKRQGGVTKETRLSEIEGLSIWHQSRLQQEGIDNVQNLAMADVPALVIRTPYTVQQIVDWVDQAILLIYARQENIRKHQEDMFAALERVGLRCASDALTATEDKHLNQLVSATGQDKNGLRMLHLALKSAPNINLILNFHREPGTDNSQGEKAIALSPTSEHR